MTFFSVHPFLSFNIAAVLLILGKLLTLNLDVLRRYSIPEPVAGGFRDGRFQIMRLDVDATYDGEVNPVTLIDRDIW